MQDSGPQGPELENPALCCVSPEEMKRGEGGVHLCLEVCRDSDSSRTVTGTHSTPLCPLKEPKESMDGELTHD